MIRIELTRRQTRQLKKHFRMIRTAFNVGQRGTFVAQVEQDWWEPGNAYVRAHFFPGNLAVPIQEAVKNARLPNCYAGIPKSVFQPRSAHTSSEQS